MTRVADLVARISPALPAYGLQHPEVWDALDELARLAEQAPAGDGINVAHYATSATPPHPLTQIGRPAGLRSTDPLPGDTHG